MNRRQALLHLSDLVKDELAKSPPEGFVMLTIAVSTADGTSMRTLCNPVLAEQVIAAGPPADVIGPAIHNYVRKLEDAAAKGSVTP
jgi:hypothetical protein